MNGLKAIGLTVMLIGSAAPALAQLPGEPRRPFQYDATGDAKYNFERGAPDARVRDAQRVLQERGFYHGPLDGLMTPEMRRAVWNFQKAQGFRLSGRLEPQTMGALGLTPTGATAKDAPSSSESEPSALPGSFAAPRSTPDQGSFQAP